jgi:hypothetical protein
MASYLYAAYMGRRKQWAHRHNTTQETGLILFDDFPTAGSTMGWFTKTYDMPKVWPVVKGEAVESSWRKDD